MGEELLKIYKEAKMSDEEAREYISLIFEGYRKRKMENRLYRHDDIPMMIIHTYYSCVEKPNFSEIYYNFKRRYIYNESRVEWNVSPEEQQGVGLAYEYVNKYNFQKQKFNIFIDAILIHQKLYSKYGDGTFGGRLREMEVFLYDSNVEVPPSKVAREYFQNYCGMSDMIMESLESEDIVKYINACVFLTTELIKIQPFQDGNKRTFRTLLNLMFKKRSIPPVYITTKEKDEYKEALMKALTDGNYNDLYQFYYYKVCDSIYELDIAVNNSFRKNDNELVKVKKIEA